MSTQKLWAVKANGRYLDASGAHVYTIDQAHLWKTQVACEVYVGTDPVRHSKFEIVPVTRTTQEGHVPCPGGEPMNCAEVDRWLIDNPGQDAADLVELLIPGISREFMKLDKAIAKLLSKVQEKFPDAEFYTTGGDGFALLLGPSHGDSNGRGERARQEREALCYGHAKIDGGDWQ